MAKVPVGKGGRGAGGALPEETRAILGATTNAGKAARSGLGGLLANAGDEARGFWQALQTPMGAANLATGFLGRFAAPAQVALEAARDPNALVESPETAIPLAVLRSQTPVGLFEQSPGWNQFAQGARQQVTETLTAPGEVLKPGGVGRISKRSAKNLVKMLKGIRQGFYDAPVASTLGMVAPALHMASAHTPAANVADDAGMVAYHGTPHTFEPTANNPLGEFDLSKMGSGEGAQAYGWGQYLAENPKIAQYYRKSLTTDYTGPNGERVDYGSLRLRLHKVVEPVLDKALHDLNDIREANGLPRLRFDFYNEVGSIVDDLMDFTDQNKGNYMDHHVPLPSISDAYRAGAAEAQKYRKNWGRLYTVDVPDEHVAGFLDWDETAVSQPTNVKQAYADLFDGVALVEPGATGKDLYRAIARELGSDEAASKYLASKGVLGLKFLDQTSRKAKQGTRNLVIFDPSITTITARK